MNCTLIEFTQEFTHMSSYKVKAVLEWIQTHAGDRNKGWKWLRGDIRGNGIYIVDSQVALMVALAYPELVLKTSSATFPVPSIS